MPDLQSFASLCKWLGRDPREFLGMETNEAATRPRAVVHFKKKKTVQVETAKALGELILAAQRRQLVRLAKRLVIGAGIALASLGIDRLVLLRH